MTKVFRHWLLIHFLSVSGDYTKTSFSELSKKAYALQCTGVPFFVQKVQNVAIFICHPRIDVMVKKTFHILPSLGENRIFVKQADLGMAFAWLRTEQNKYLRFRAG